MEETVGELLICARHWSGV